MTNVLSGQDPELSEEEEEEEDGEGEEPPVLKYNRITALPPSFFQRDSISACLFYEQFFAFGTHSGLLHITSTGFEPLHTLKCHRSSIMSIHTDGTSFATCSIDGTVVIGSIEDTTKITAYDFKRPVFSVLLAHDYSATKSFVSGGMAGEVIYSTRNWVGNRTDITLSKNNGPITGIFGLGDVILWTNNAGLTFYHIATRKQLLNVPFSVQELAGISKEDVRPDLYKPHVHTPENDRIIVGWGYHIWSFRVSNSAGSKSSTYRPIESILSSAASSLRVGGPEKSIILEHDFQVGVDIAGIASFKDDQLMILGLDKQNDTPSPPTLIIIDITTGEEVHTDEVICKGYERNTLNDYHLGNFVADGKPSEYFLLNSTDCIRISELSLQDNFNWYLKNDRFHEAWDISRYIASVGIQERLMIGTKYINKAIQEKNWAEASKAIYLVFTDNSVLEASDVEEVYEQWENKILEIIDAGHLDSTIEYVPLSPILSKKLYDTILQKYLDDKQYSKFSSLIRQWPVTLYSAETFTDRLGHMIENIEEKDSLVQFKDNLVYIYLEQEKYSKAIEILLDQKKPQALELLSSHDLLYQFKARLLDIILLEYKGNSIEDIGKLSMTQVETIFQKAILLLIENRHSILPKDIIKILSSPKELRILLLLYFEKLANTEPLMAAQYENNMIDLYLQYKKASLLPFLKAKSNYDVQKAIASCSEKQGSQLELIYLWGKIGETKRALSLIIDEMDDPSAAIAFVKEWGSSELWEFMINYSMDKPKFVKAFLESPDNIAETYLELIKGMPEDMEVDDLKVVITKILRQNALNDTIGDNVFEIINNETVALAFELLKARSKGKVFSVEE